MKQLINEAKRMQQLAGVLKEVSDDKTLRILSDFNYAIDKAWKALAALKIDSKLAATHLKSEFNYAIRDLAQNGVMEENEDMSGDLNSQIRAKVIHYYGDEEPTEDQINKLVSIYRHEMDNIGTVDVEDFFLDLEDSSDPGAFVSLKSLSKYKGY